MDISFPRVHIEKNILDIYVIMDNSFPRVHIEKNLKKKNTISDVD
jgi:hypothetical protein